MDLSSLFHGQYLILQMRIVLVILGLAILNITPQSTQFSTAKTFTLWLESDGIHTWFVNRPDGGSQYQLDVGPSWSDAAGYASAYNTLRTYTANNVPYLAILNSTSYATSENDNFKNWITCALDNLDWDCSGNSNLTPALPQNGAPSFNVGLYNWLNGSLPVFSYLNITLNPFSINMSIANPTVVLTNVNNPNVQFVPNG